MSERRKSTLLCLLLFGLSALAVGFGLFGGYPVLFPVGMAGSMVVGWAWDHRGPASPPSP